MSGRPCISCGRAIPAGVFAEGEATEVFCPWCAASQAPAPSASEPAVSVAAGHPKVRRTVAGEAITYQVRTGSCFGWFWLIFTIVHCGFMFFGMSQGNVEINGQLVDHPAWWFFLLLGLFYVPFFLIGFAFKVSAVPFHQWAPDTYEGAPTPITAFLSVASKAAGFVALVTLVYVGFPFGIDVWKPLFWVLAVITMTVGNVLALKQTNIVRMLAYSSVSQGGFILMPLFVAWKHTPNGLVVNRDTLTAVVTYLLVYAAMNLGAFGVILAVSRKTKSGDVSSFGGLFSYSPALAVAMTLFMGSLAGIPPLGGWIAKFTVIRALASDGSGWATTLAVIGMVNAVIAVGYYGNVLREVWMRPVPDGDTSRIRVPSSLGLALVICSAATLVMGILNVTPDSFADAERFDAGRAVAVA